MVCPGGKIMNPKTGRCVKKSGKIGRELMGKSPVRRKRKTPVRKSHKACPSGKVLNPKTGRCVSRRGKLGKEILAKKIVRSRLSPGQMTLSKFVKPVKPIGLPSKFKEIAEDCAETGKWEKKGFIGAGAYGEVYTACRAGNCDYVLKMQQNGGDFRHEVKALHALNNWKYSPKIYAAWTCKNTGFIVEEKVVKCNLDRKEMYTQLKKILTELHKKRWVFVDIHEGNVMCKQGGKNVILIDFGWARHLLPGQKVRSHAVANLIGRPVDFKDLVVAETGKLEEGFGVRGSKEYRKALKAWNDLGR